MTDTEKLELVRKDVKTFNEYLEKYKKELKDATEKGDELAAIGLKHEIVTFEFVIKMLELSLNA